MFFEFRESGIPLVPLLAHPWPLLCVLTVSKALSPQKGDAREEPPQAWVWNSSSWPAIQSDIWN